MPPMITTKKISIWIEELLAGDPIAWKKLYHFNLNFQLPGEFSSDELNWHDRSDVADYVNKTLFPRFCVAKILPDGGPACVWSYIRTTLLREARRVINARQKRGEVSFDESTTTDVDECQTAPSLGDIAAHALWSESELPGHESLWDRVFALAERLPARYKEVMVPYFHCVQHDPDTEDRAFASSMGLTSGHFAVIKQRALEMMRRMNLGERNE